MSLARLDAPRCPASIDATALHQHPVFRCGDLQSSQFHMRSVIADHHIRSSAGEIDSSLFAARAGRLQFMLLRYGAEVEITPRGAFDDFSLVQIPLTGATAIDCDGHKAELLPGQSALVAPRRHLRLVWSSDCEQLIVRIPNSLLRSTAAGNAQRYESARNLRGTIAPLTTMKGLHAKRWNALVQSLVDAVNDAGAQEEAHPAWIEHSEVGLALYLLTMQSTTGDGPIDGKPRPHSGRNDPIALAERFARSRLCAPIALEDLARAAGVSARTLHMHCTREFNVGPMEWLRNLRLDIARERLQQSRSVQVTEVAMSCGFGHLGRFAAYYRERFGELPRDTAAMI
jgi:AraC-like DNA-binding protein